MYERIVRLIPPEQHGFIKGKATTTNLFEAAQFIFDETAKAKQVDAVYFDFAKAFDRISHHILARKLTGASMPQRLYMAIMNFVVNREYIFNCTDCSLELKATATSGVPQGSHMGPLLFVFYARDILDSINHPSLFISLLADDTKFLCSIGSIQDAQLLQDAIDSLCKWSDENKLELNAAKTTFVSFPKKKRRTFDTRYFIGITVIEKETSHVDLGVVFDQNLKFQLHHEFILNKCNRIIEKL